MVLLLSTVNSVFFGLLFMQVLIKPPVKENTRPVDLRLHSDVRAEERAEFDHQVLFNNCLIGSIKFWWPLLLKCFDVYLFLWGGVCGST